MAVAIQTRSWTIEDLERLPDDGNRYEVVRGELFVTPAANPPHEAVIARLTDLLGPYVAAQRLGRLHHRAAVEFDGSHVEPDLTVGHPPVGESWRDVPLPILVVEILSRSTERRDRVQKRRLYVDAGIAEYWMADRHRRSITVCRRGDADREVTDQLSWLPRGATEALVFDVASVFAPFERTE